jgi:hypothetical protein
LRRLKMREIREISQVSKIEEFTEKSLRGETWRYWFWPSLKSLKIFGWLTRKFAARMS